MSYRVSWVCECGASGDATEDTCDQHRECSTSGSIRIVAAGPEMLACSARWEVDGAVLHCGNKAPCKAPHTATVTLSRDWSRTATWGDLRREYTDNRLGAPYRMRGWYV